MLVEEEDTASESTEAWAREMLASILIVGAVHASDAGAVELTMFERVVVG